LSNYEVQDGDTLESIARKQYGIDDKQALIQNANPGLPETLTPGTNLTTPTDPDAPTDVVQNVGTEPDTVSILVNGQRFRFWESVTLRRSLDAFDTVGFSAIMDATAPGFKETFRPFSFQTVEIFIGSTRFFTGTMIGVSPDLQPSTKRVSVSCYAKPGVLVDCNMPASAYPLQFFDQGLQEISATLAAPFGIGVEFSANQGDTFEDVTCDISRKVHDFLSDLARQRNLVISNTADGKMVFQSSIASGQPVVTIDQGKAPLVEVVPNFNPQNYYSDVTGIEPTILGLEGAQFTVKNDKLKGVIRPHTFVTQDTQEGAVPAAVNAKMGRMFGNMASYSVRVPTWRDPQDNLWEPNTIVKLTAPDAMIYNAYDFVIRSVEFTRTPTSFDAILNLVMPGSFSGEIPEVLPWD